MTFQQKLDRSWKKQESFLCIGLDSDIERLPKQFRQREDGQYYFNRAIIDKTHDLVCAYKLNSAFYEGEGAYGIRQLCQTVTFLKKTYSHIPIILDCKRADIASTNIGYIRFAFEYLGVDAITLHPYLGREALLPFLKMKEKGFFILCKTSNPGADEFQDLKTGNSTLYEVVANNVSKKWNTNNNCMLVVGATYPEELKKVRNLIGEMTILLPGIGAQGGNLERTVQYGLNNTRTGIIINSSRGVIFASRGKDFAQAARIAALAIQSDIIKAVKMLR